MAVVALALYALYLAVTFGLRTLIQLRRTGSTGFHGLGGRPGSAEWIAGVGFTVALLIGAAAPALALLGAVEPIAALDSTAVHIAGLVLAVGRDRGDLLRAGGDGGELAGRRRPGGAHRSWSPPGPLPSSATRSSPRCSPPASA